VNKYSLPKDIFYESFIQPLFCNYSVGDPSRRLQVWSFVLVDMHLHHVGVTRGGLRLLAGTISTATRQYLRVP
jgi:hypothetical protein